VLDWKKLKYIQCNDFLQALDSISRVREMIRQHHTDQTRKREAKKKPGTLGQHYPKLQQYQAIPAEVVVAGINSD
jgi:hypothetical protein